MIIRDITERRLAEEELDRLHRHHQVVLNSAGEGIYGVDREGRTTFVNPAAAKRPFGFRAGRTHRQAHACAGAPHGPGRDAGSAGCVPHL
ncbi:MAG: hypothetical protein U0361_06230 [Nitrospiraceae bacterium]